MENRRLQNVSGTSASFKIVFCEGFSEGVHLDKMMSRNKFKHLMKDCVTMGHSPKSPFCLMSYGLTHSNRFREVSDFF